VAQVGTSKTGAEIVPRFPLACPLDTR